MSYQNHLPSPSLETQRHWHLEQARREINKYKLPPKVNRSTVGNSRTSLKSMLLLEKWLFSHMVERGVSIAKIFDGSSPDLQYVDPVVPCCDELDDKVIQESLRKDFSPSDRLKISKFIVGTLAHVSPLLSAAASKKGQRRVVIEEGGGKIQLKYGKCAVGLKHEYYKKLHGLYLNNFVSEKLSPEQLEDFHVCLFSMLMRYKMIEGGGFQAAVPVFVLDVLKHYFGCEYECFASPINCYYRKYCSAFFDTDRFFGSSGSFFQFEPKEGVYEANPPFVPFVVCKMQSHMEKLLIRNSNHPLLFIIVVPAWRNEDCWNDLCKSTFLLYHFIIPSNEHIYFEGKQHLRKTQYRNSSCDTSVFFIGNVQAFKKWQSELKGDAHVELIHSIKDAFKGNKPKYIYQKVEVGDISGASVGGRELVDEKKLEKNMEKKRGAKRKQIEIEERESSNDKIETTKKKKWKKKKRKALRRTPITASKKK